MRKIEQDVISTIRYIAETKPGTGESGAVNLSTRDRIEYETTPSGLVLITVRLHGNVIATMTPGNGYMCIFSRRHQTATTKSRLNCLFTAFTQSRLYQKNYAWYVAHLDGNTEPFTEGMTLRIKL